MDYLKIKNAIIYVGPGTKIQDCIYFLYCTFVTWGEITIEEMKEKIKCQVGFSRGCSGRKERNADLTASD